MIKKRKKVWIFLIILLLIILITIKVFYRKLNFYIIDEYQNDNEEQIKSLIALSEKNYNVKNKEITPHIDENSGEKYITYEDFYNDKYTDDYTAIKDAHNYANSHNLNVRATKKVYNIYKNEVEPIEIKTNTNWENSTIYIHDEMQLSKDVATNSIFRISGSEEKYKTKYITSKEELKNLNIKQTDKNIKFLSGNGNALVIIFNDEKKISIRSEAQSNGDIQFEILKVDNEGNILNDIVRDIEHISALLIIPIPENRLTIQNGNFVTITNGEENKEYYYNRNIVCSRSNTLIKNINHSLSDSKKLGGPYYGFIKTLYVTNVDIENCDLCAHKYKKTSNYDLALTYSCDIILNNVKCNDIMDETRWGCVVGNYIKDITYTKCCLNRIDSHTEIHNLTIDDCIIGCQGISVCGSGKLIINNTTNNDNRAFVILRSDYGSRWDGDIIIKNSTYNYNQEGILIQVNAVKDDKKVWHNYGYDLKMPNIYLYNLKLNGNNNKFYIFYNTEETTLSSKFNFSESHILPDVVEVTDEVNDKIIMLFKNDCSDKEKVKFKYNKIEEWKQEIIETNKKIKEEYSQIYSNDNPICIIYDELINKLSENNKYKLDEIYEQQMKLAKEIVSEFNSGIISMEKSNYVKLVTSIINITEKYESLYDACIYDDEVPYKKVQENLNKIIDRYNNNLDIDLSKETDIINQMKEIYNTRINNENVAENYLNKQRILKTCDIASSMLENDIKQKADTEYNAITISSGKGINNYTNQDETITINLPKNAQITSESSNVFKFSSNGTKDVKLSIRGYEYTYTIKVNNIDKTVPKVTAENGQSLKINVTDDNLKEIKIENDGKETVVNNGQTITIPGIYKIIATDKAGNSANETAIVYGTYTNEQNSQVNYVTIKAKTKVSDIKQDGNYTIKDNNNTTAGVKREPSSVNTNAEKNSNSYIATGDILQENNNIYIIVTLGDLSSNGDVGAADLIKLRKSLVGLTKLTKLQELAADTNQSGSVNVSDLLKERKIMVGME